MKIDRITIERRAKEIIGKIGSTVIIPRWGGYSPNFFYFAGMDIDHSVLVLHKNGDITLISNKLNEALVKERYEGIADVLFYDKKNTVRDVLKNVCGNSRCALDASVIPHVVYRRMHLKGMKPIGREILSVREVKDNREIEVMREVKRKTMSILNAISKEDMRGKSEQEIKKMVLVEIAKMGCTEAFETIVANSRNARFPHYIDAGRDKITDYVLIDMGVKYKHYNSDMTRCIGDLDGMAGPYEQLRNASLEVADAAVAGKKIGEFVKEVDIILKRNGLREFPHGIGHGVGLEVHEFPHLYAGSTDTLKENSVITIEPGQYFKKGIRYEDMYIIGKKKARLL